MARSFTEDLSRIISRTRGNARLVVRKVLIECGESVVMKTPVGDPSEWAPGAPVPAGYVGGRARGSWQYAKGEPDRADPGTIDKTGQVSRDRIKIGATVGDPLDVHFITSSVPYMRPLEYDGHSRQAPEGMVRKTVLEFQENVARAVRELP